MPRPSPACPSSNARADVTVAQVPAARRALRRAHLRLGALRRRWWIARVRLARRVRQSRLGSGVGILPARSRPWAEALHLVPSPRAVPAERLLLGDGGAGPGLDKPNQAHDLLLPSTPLPSWPAVTDPRSRVVDLASRTARDVLPRVKQVHDSDCFVVLDGHGPLADAFRRGEHRPVVRVVAGRAWTPLQEFLRTMDWLQGRRELYQPIDAPELAHWTLVRACTDRLELMRRFLADRALLPPATASSLDIGANYGWFVAQMRDLGFDARGIELDPLGPELASQVYGVEPSRITVGDCAVALLDHEPADVVTCLSVAHHFVIGNGSVPGDELMRRIAGVTTRVLFFDTGESHEVALRDILPGWTPEYVAQWLRATTDFDEVIALGRDHDDVGTFAREYGRTLFACVRHGSADDERDDRAAYAEAQRTD